MTDYKNDMLDVLPMYYQQSPQFDTLLTAYDVKLKEMQLQIDKLNSNIKISTAVETLPVHERDLGLQVPDTFAPVLRREQIIAKYRSAFDQTTEEAIIAVAESFAEGTIAFEETITPGLYTITFTSQLGVPYNMEGLQKAVRNMLPAHLEVNYLYVYNTWEWALDKTWNAALADTWHEFRTKEV